MRLGSWKDASDQRYSSYPFSSRFNDNCRICFIKTIDFDQAYFQRLIVFSFCYVWKSLWSFNLNWLSKEKFIWKWETYEWILPRTCHVVLYQKSIHQIVLYAYILVQLFIYREVITFRPRRNSFPYDHLIIKVLVDFYTLLIDPLFSKS